MDMNCYSVYDSKAGMFMPPFYQHSHALAERVMIGALMEREHQFFKHAEDFTLFFVGVWSDEFGTFTMDEPPQAVANLAGLKAAMGE